MEKQNQTIISFLSHFKYVDNDNNILMKGILASQINECNCLILTEMIINNIFDDMTCYEIIGLLGIFIRDTKKDEEFIDNIKSNKIKSKLSFIKNIIEKFIEYENYLGITNEDEEFWDLDYRFINVAYTWAMGENFNKIIVNNEIYEGNFIKGIIKINNLVNDLISLTKIHGNLKIIPTLEKIEEIIIRDLVKIESLYIKN